MAKKVNSKSSSKSVVKNTVKKTTVSKKKTAKKNGVVNKINVRRINPRIALLVIFLCAVLLIFASYAWFSTNLNIKIKSFNLVVSKNSDLTISFDGVNFDRTIEINKDNIYVNLGELYPNHLTQWPTNGLIPVSSPGLTNPDTHLMDFYHTNGVLYNIRDKEKMNGFVRTYLSKQDKINEFSSYLAFDLFIKNDTGSPHPDNLYLDNSVYINAVSDEDEEIQGLVNSFRVGIVRIGSVDLDASVNQIQNIQCDNECFSTIYEPRSRAHTDLSIERAKKFNVDLVDGDSFPTYAYVKAGGPIYVKNSISGSSSINREYFTVQETITDEDLETPLFQIPNGITKVRVYVWIEGQDIDSLETNSKGTDVDVSISFVKDTAGWEEFNDE